MSQLELSLSRLGLQEYLEPLVSHGFVTWEHLLKISEDNMAELGFKLGHRRKLQRAIALYQGQPFNQPLIRSPDRFFYQSESPTSASLCSVDDHDDEEPMPTRRKYQRHQPTDPHAPPRPKSGYVMFANFLRQNPLVSELPFVEISKLVGQEWYRLSPDEKTMWMSRATEQKSKYESELAEYKKTTHYRRHQDQLRASWPTSGARHRGRDHHGFPRNGQRSQSGQKCLRLTSASTSAMGDHLKYKEMLVGAMQDGDRAASQRSSGSGSVS